MNDNKWSLTIGKNNKADYLSMTLGVIKMWSGWGTSYISPIDDHPDSNFILDRLSLSISPGS